MIAVFVVAGYGSFPGGDPRHWEPDPECCTPTEIEAHRVACEEAAAGVNCDLDGDWCGAIRFGLGSYEVEMEERLVWWWALGHNLAMAGGAAVAVLNHVRLGLLDVEPNASREAGVLVLDPPIICGDGLPIDWAVPVRHVPVLLAANEDAEWALEAEEAEL